MASFRDIKSLVLKIYGVRPFQCHTHKRKIGKIKLSGAGDVEVCDETKIIISYLKNLKNESWHIDIKDKNDRKRFL